MKLLKITPKIFLAFVLFIAGFLVMQPEKASNQAGDKIDFSQNGLTTFLSPSLFDSRAKDKTDWFANIIPEAQAAAPFDALNNRKLTVYGGVITLVNGTATATNALEIGQARDGGLGLASTGNIYLLPNTGKNLFINNNTYMGEPSGAGTWESKVNPNDKLAVFSSRPSGSNIYAQNTGGGYAGYFSGKVQVSADLAVTAFTVTQTNSNFPAAYFNSHVIISTNVSSTKDALEVNKSTGTGAAAKLTANNASNVLDVTQSGSGYAGYFSGKNYMTKLGVGQVNPTATLVVNNNINESGSAGDAIYASANSVNSTLYAKQAGAGYAGYFAGRATVGSATSLIPTVGGINALEAYSSGNSGFDLRYDFGANAGIKGVFSNNAAGTGGAGVYGYVDNCPAAGSKCAGIFGYSRIPNQYAALFQGKVNFYGPASGNNLATFSGGNVEMRWNDLNNNPLPNIGGTNLYIGSSNATSGSGNYARALGVQGGESNAGNFSNAIQVKAGKAVGFNGGESTGIYAETDDQSDGYTIAGYFKANSPMAVAYAGYFEGNVRFNGKTVFKRFSFEETTLGNEFPDTVPVEIYNFRSEILSRGILCIEGGDLNTEEELGPPTPANRRKCFKINEVLGCRQSSGDCIIGVVDTALVGCTQVAQICMKGCGTPTQEVYRKNRRDVSTEACETSYPIGGVRLYY